MLRYAIGGTALIPGFQWPEPEDASDEKLISDVLEYGVHIINVFTE